MEIFEYRRSDVLEYAEKWAFKRNHRYFDFENIGGDCTSFVSQCIYAGCGVMNYTRDTGWYYNSAGDRAAAWSSVQYLYKFLTTNKGAGPFASVVGRSEIEAGDVVQLGNDTDGFHHSLIVVKATDQQIFVASHSFDTFMRPLDSYTGEHPRFLHIEGCRK